MKSYFRMMLGINSVYAPQCVQGGFIGADFNIQQDLSGQLPDEWRAFNKKFIPVYLSTHPGKSKIAAGLACGALWTVAKGMQQGDIVLSPDGAGRYHVGEICGDYRFVPNTPLPHQRPVRWLSVMIDRPDMSEALRNSAGSIGTVSNVSSYASEIEQLIGGGATPVGMATGQAVDAASAFAVEKHLEEYLVKNWAQTELGRVYDIYEEDGADGQQYQTDTGPLDLLCVSKDKKTLLVVELKRGAGTDETVGQILRYMGYVREMLAEDSQTVKGVIIAHEDSLRIRRALQMVPAVEFLRYEISFKLVRDSP